MVFFAYLFVILIRIIKGILKHPRYLILIGVVVFIFIGGRSVTRNISGALTGGDAEAAPDIPAYQLTAPDKALARTIVQTNSRLYYVNDYTDNGRTVRLLAYYGYNGDDWVKSNTPLPLDRQYYGEIRIYER